MRISGKEEKDVVRMSSSTFRVLWLVALEAEGGRGDVLGKYGGDIVMEQALVECR